MKRIVKIHTVKKASFVANELKRLVVAIASVKATPEIEQRATDLVAKSRQAKSAVFLEKYRSAAH